MRRPHHRRQRRPTCLSSNSLVAGPLVEHPLVGGSVERPDRVEERLELVLPVVERDRRAAISISAGSSPGTGPGDVSISTSASTRSGWASTMRRTTIPPIECPSRRNASMPTASATPRVGREAVERVRGRVGRAVALAVTPVVEGDDAVVARRACRRGRRSPPWRRRTRAPGATSGPRPDSTTVEPDAVVGHHPHAHPRSCRAAPAAPPDDAAIVGYPATGSGRCLRPRRPRSRRARPSLPAGVGCAWSSARCCSRSSSRRSDLEDAPPEAPAPLDARLPRAGRAAAHRLRHRALGLALAAGARACSTPTSRCARSTRHYFAGQFVGNVLPSTIGGDVLRVSRSADEHRLERDASFASVAHRAAERLPRAARCSCFFGFAVDPSLLESTTPGSRSLIAGGALAALGVILAARRAPAPRGPLRRTTRTGCGSSAPCTSASTGCATEPREALGVLGAALIYQVSVVAAVVFVVQTLDARRSRSARSSRSSPRSRWRR